MKKTIDRRAALATIFGSLAAACVAGCAGTATKGEKDSAELEKPAPAAPPVPEAKVPKINPKLCKACGRCAAACTKDGSAVKCENKFKICGYCVYCYGYFKESPESNPNAIVCPTGALVRRQLEKFRFEYSINITKCIACGACVRNCVAHGNKSLRLVVKKELCLGCAECEAIKACPYSAISRQKA